MNQGFSNTSGRFDPLCLILGWLLPGMGHMWLGQPRRGVRVMVGILAMFFVGLLVGGVDVVDWTEQPLWFLPQALVGPLAFGADHLNGAFVKTGRLGTVSLNKVNEAGTLFIALAGLLNLAAMIDASTRDPDSEMEAGGAPRRRHAERRAPA